MKSIQKPAGRLDAAPGRRPIVGGHCESSALVNALVPLGYDVSEADLAGGGGAPSFMLSADAFPFLGGRSEKMRETFFAGAGVEYRPVVPAKAAELWEPVFARLAAGSPVPLRVDMRWLPYRYGGKFGPAYMSFGWHYICLFAVDRDRGLAFVSDTELPDLQAIKLADLTKARTSPLKRWPPRGEWVELAPAPAAWRLDRARLVRAGLAAVAANLDGNDGWSAAGLPIPTGLAGLRALPAYLADFDAKVKSFLAAPALGFLADCIERNGTGGSAFRRLFRDFVAASRDELASAGCDGRAAARAAALSTLLPAVEASVAAWTRLADRLAAAGARLAAKPAPKPAERSAAFAAAAAAAGELAAAEGALRAALDPALAAFAD